MGATFTQWIFDQDSCACKLVTESEKPSVASRGLCMRCSKPLPVSGRSGSLTQWIFRQSSCACEDGGLAGSDSKNRLDSIAEEETFADEGDEELLRELGLPASRYAAIDLISRGNTSVYRCWDKSLGRMVAIKKFDHSRLTKDQIIQFQNEARTTSSLRHEGIVQLLDFGMNDRGQPYMTMEFVDGISLAKFINKEGALPVERALSIAGKVAEAIEFAHQKGVYHRDLKSSNILIADNRVTVIDFGIARFIQSQDSHKDGESLFEGTPGYMSPEQLAGKKFDRRSEVYSLASVLFESLTGRLPIVADNPLTILETRETGSLPSLQEANPQGDFSHALEDLIARSLDVNPDMRPDNMRDMETEINQLIEETRFSLRSDSSAASSEIEQLNQSEKQPGETSKLILLVGALVTVLATVIAGFLFINNISTQMQYPVERVRREETLITTFLTDSFEDAKKSKSSLPPVPKPIVDGSFRRLLGEEITDKTLDGIVHLPLKTLTIMHSASVTDKGIAKLAKMKTLRNLLIHDCPSITYIGYRSLSSMQLGYLQATSNNLTPSVIPEIAKIASLGGLMLRRNPRLNGADFSSLSNLKSLFQLDLSDIVLTESNIDSLSAITNLRDLSISRCKLDDDAATKISKLKNLQRLDLRFNRITDIGLARLSELPKLRTLWITPVTISEEGIRAFQQSCPNCTISFDGELKTPFRTKTN